MTDTGTSANEEGTADKSSDGIAQGTYALLRGRLESAARELTSRADALNARRLEAFGSAKLELTTTERVRTELNTIPRDLASIDSQLIMAYNAEVGVRAEVRPEDVFSVHHLEVGSESQPGVWFSPNTEGLSGSALDDDQFRRDFEELHTYFSQTKLEQLYAVGQKLLAVFRTGGGEGDLRVFRWEIGLDGTLSYLDARGDRDHRFPASQDVSWTLATRADHVAATHVKLGERVLIDPLGGSLVIQLADGGGDGSGTKLLSDRLEHADQSLQDCTIRWAAAGDLLLVDVLPYGEVRHRYYVVNLLVDHAVRLDALGAAFRQLPDGQGLIFPEGIYLKTGEMRTFDVDSGDAELLEVVRSPNGEDVLYVFHERTSGRSILLPYNVVRQEVAAPIWCHGHTIFADGTMVVFREEPEPTRIHPMQIWATPFGTDEWYAKQPRSSSDLDRIGNASLVSGIADALALTRLIADVEPSTAIYTDLLMSAGRFTDTHHWSGDQQVGNLAESAHDIRVVAEQVIDEFERMQAVASAAADALAAAEVETLRITEDLRLSPPTATEGFIDGLAAIRRQIGHLHTEKERRGIDLVRIDELIDSTTEAHDSLAQAAAAHLAADGAFAPYHDQLQTLAAATQQAASSLDATETLASVDALAESMDLVANTVSDLVVDDPRVRTSVLEQVAGVLAEMNRVRAGVEGKRDALIQSETGAAFATELGLFGQSIATAVSRANTPEACDEALARLLLQLEHLETAGPRTDIQIDELATRRDQVTEALTTKRQQLVDDRQQRADRLVTAATRTLDRVAERAQTMASIDDVNGFYAADPMVSRVRKLVDDLRDLGEPVRADELQSQLGASRDRANRALRDRQDLFDGDAVKLGRFRFSVDDRTRELTLIPGEEHLQAVLTGTDLRLPIEDERLDAHRDLWDQPLASETASLYRSAFLAGDLLLAALDDRSEITGTTSLALPVRRTRAGKAGGAIGDTTALLDQVRVAVDHRLDEGYDRGVHDLDAARILAFVGPLAVDAGALVIPSDVRATAQVSWSRLDEKAKSMWVDRGRAIASATASRTTLERLTSDLGADLDVADQRVARYLLTELTRTEGFSFAQSAAAATRTAELVKEPQLRAVIDAATDDIDGLLPVVADAVTRAMPGERHVVPEVAVALALPELERRTVDVDLEFTIDGLNGRHPTVVDGTLVGRVDDLLAAVAEHRATALPMHREFGAARRETLESLRRRLRVDDLEPRVPDGFVRNRLIDTIYLPLIGDNLARQIGTVDDQGGQRSGLLMLLSPPGYGKTTLVEYVADRLGMALVKVSGPGLGHEVTSLDPGQAPSATAAREIERINLAFAVGTNVILYLDDIQHTNPELLQRFISLCDAQRRVEGVWNGESRTFDLRGKRFAVVMAGNPYTESGDRFRIPDMLANRADTYNLGDVLAGNEDVFARSYTENALTANQTLAPLAGRSPADLDRFLRAAGGSPLEESALEHSYSSAEANEIVTVLGHLRRVQEVVLKVNRQYIASAATDDQYRTEPPFLLQGSYRNMARMASKLLPAMTANEVERVVDEHYVAESQALTGQAETNLLKLGEMRGTLSDDERTRWDDILRVFQRQQRLGGDDRDPATRVVAAIEQVAETLSRQGGQSSELPVINVTVPAPVIMTAPVDPADLPLEPSPDLTPDEDPVPPFDPR